MFISMQVLVTIAAMEGNPRLLAGRDEQGKGPAAKAFASAGPSKQRCHWVGLEGYRERR